ncbi:hypothetical protein AYO41_04300 [Verrucomicrobia bacterium SCGC AG-212-E04]|nr:hypothetical protein AYO41_04300 [Verrucomicrobia bacterium SCGC AG-212-E04]
MITSAAACFVVGCASTTSQSKENLLVTAGFRTLPADTAAKQTLLKSLPEGQLSAVQRNGRTYYVYPQLASNTALVGTEKELTAFRQLKDLKQISDRNLEQSIKSSSVSGWGAWGGWGW